MIQFHGTSMPEGAALSWSFSDIVIRRKNGFDFRCHVRGCSLLDQRPVSAHPGPCRAFQRRSLEPQIADFRRASAPSDPQRRLLGQALSFRAAVLMGAAGMLWGLYVGVSEDHSAMPAHAHLNFLGWVSLFLFGAYYRLHPELDRSRYAMAQVLIWIIATIVMAIALGLVFSWGRPDIGEPITGVASTVIFRRYAALRLARVSS